MVKNHLRATLDYLGFSRQPKVTLLLSKQLHIPKELYFSLCFYMKFLVSDTYSSVIRPNFVIEKVHSKLN